MEEKKMTTWYIAKRQLKMLITERQYFVFFMMFINMVFAGTLPVIAAFIPRFIIDHLVSNTIESDIIMTIIFLTVFSLICAIVAVIGEYYDLGYFLGMRMKEFARINKKYHEIAYAHLEDPIFVDKAKIAFSAMNGNNMGFENVYHSIFNPYLYFFPLFYIALLLVYFNH